VIDTKTGKPVGAITGLKGTHGVALDDSGKFGYISDGRANAVVVFDRSSFATVATVPVGTNPDGIVFEPVTKTVWTFNGGSKDATVVDTASRKVIATVKLPGRPEFPVADGKGLVFDNIEDKNAIVRIDAKTHQVTATWAACESPSGLAIDIAGSRLFAVCDGKKMAVVDAKTGKLLASPAIGDGPDAAAYDPKTKLAYASNGDGTLTVIDASNASYKVLQTLPTQKSARTMALDSSTGKVFLAAAKMGPPPAPTAANPHPWPSVVPGTFTVLVAGHE
jgi:YVTN family beta-propeller protein